MKWTTLYRKWQGEVEYYSLSIEEANGEVRMHIEKGSLTLHKMDYRNRPLMSSTEAAIHSASKTWNLRREEGWRCAQELGINSNNQSWTPPMFRTLEQLLQQLLP